MSVVRNGMTYDAAVLRGVEASEKIEQQGTPSSYLIVQLSKS